MRALIKSWRVLLVHSLAAISIVIVDSTVCRADPTDKNVTSTATLTEAMQQLGAGDAVAARKLLERITQQEPLNAIAWRALAKCLQQLHDYRGAIEAYRHSLVIDAGAPQAFYGMGVAYAAQHDSDRAFLWLKQARDTHRYDMTQVEFSPALTEDTDARYVLCPVRK